MTDSDTLAILLAELRLELRAEAPSVLHSHAAPTLRDSDGLTVETDPGGIGMPFTAAMHRFLGHSETWGVSRLGMSSIMEVSDACAARHPTHRRPLFTRTVCGQLVFAVGYLGQSVEDLVWITGMERAQVEGLLLWGLRHAAEWRVERFARSTREPGHEAPMPERRPYKPAA